MTRGYAVVLTPQPEGGDTVTSPDFLELVTESETREEARAMARDCAEVVLLSVMDHGEDIPNEGRQAEVATIDVDLDALRAQLAGEKIAVGV
jgi:predicted RNase H-like HicB family nuclease